jgi:hypothetical protein
MSPTSWKAESQALRLALDVAASEGCCVSRGTISRHFGSEADLLLEKGILRPNGLASSAVSGEDLPATVVWSPERNEFGYFSNEDGWVSVSEESLTSYVLDVQLLVRSLTAQIDLQPKGTFAEIRRDTIWDAGLCRLPQHTKRVSVWIARRLHDPDVWTEFLEAVRERPPAGTRLVISLTNNASHPNQYIANHAVVAAVSLILADRPLEIDGEVAAARLKLPSRETKPVWLSADGGYLIVRGRSYTFRGQKHRSIVRQLFDAWDAGKPRCLTEDVLVEAECGASVRRLASLLKGHPNWRDIIKERAGMCWLDI